MVVYQLCFTQKYLLDELKSGMNIHGPQRTNHTEFSDTMRLTLLVLSEQQLSDWLPLS